MGRNIEWNKMKMKMIVVIVISDATELYWAMDGSLGVVIH